MKLEARGLSISLMLAVPDAPTAVDWYKRAIGATELWNLGSVVGLEVDGAAWRSTAPEVTRARRRHMCGCARMFHNAYGNEGLTAPCWPARSWGAAQGKHCLLLLGLRSSLAAGSQHTAAQQASGLAVHASQASPVFGHAAQTARATRTHRGPRLPQRGLRHTNSVRLWWPESDTSSAGNHAATGTTTENRMSYSKVS
jgi:hypothetical protein